MDELSREYLIAYYDRLLSLLGETPAALGWSRKGQALRYRAILDALQIKRGSSLLDYGCGMGDFYGFLREKGLDVSYTGTDINPKLAGIAGERYPGCRFMVFDVEESPVNELFNELCNEPFDYVLICGVFNQRVEGVEEAARNVIGRLWQVTRRALLFDCLSACQKTKDVSLYYYRPEALRDLARTLSPSFRVIEDAVPGDILLLLER